MAESASDAILLERFARGREEAAFVALVQRHGPMVERTCRRILRNEQDVEDVFQATFLVLARKSARIPWQESVSGWLSAVARRLAMNARSGSARQRGRETSITALTGGLTNGGSPLPERYHPVIDASAEVERRDLRQILDDELRHLPEKYRAPVVLCYLEGRTHEEAARQLGWPAGSMSRRLDRARSLLRQRLAHRGLAIAAIGLVTAAFFAVGIGRSPDDTSRAAVVREAMVPFQPSSRGGQDLGFLLATLARSDNSPFEIEQVRQLARQAARSARAVKNHDPGVLNALWQQYADEMERSATDLDLAAQEGNRLALVDAARRLDASCLRCHAVFLPKTHETMAGRTSFPEQAVRILSLLRTEVRATAVDIFTRPTDRLKPRLQPGIRLIVGGPTSDGIGRGSTDRLEPGFQPRVSTASARVPSPGGIGAAAMELRPRIPAVSPGFLAADDVHGSALRPAQIGIIDVQSAKWQAQKTLTQPGIRV